MRAVIERYNGNELLDELDEVERPSLTDFQGIGRAPLFCGEEARVLGRGRRFRECKYCGGTPRRGMGICRQCEARPKAENIRWRTIRKATETVDHFLWQKNISERNIATLGSFLEIDDPDLHEYVELTLEIARLKPRKRRRWKWLREKYPDLLARIEANANFDWLIDEGAFERDEWDGLESLLDMDVDNAATDEYHDSDFF